MRQRGSTLSSTKKPVQLGDVMITVVKTVKIIGARGLHHRELQAFLSDVDAEYGDLLDHSVIASLVTEFNQRFQEFSVVE